MSNITDKIMIILFVVVAAVIVLFLVKDEIVKLVSSTRKKSRDNEDEGDDEENMKWTKKKLWRLSPFDNSMQTQWSRGPEIEIMIKKTGEKIHHTMTEKEISIGGRNAKNVTIKIDSPFISHKHLVIKNLTDEDGPFTRIINCSKHGMTEHKIKVGGKNRWVYVSPNECVDVDEGEEHFWIGDAARVTVTVPKFAHYSFDEKTRIAGNDSDAENVHIREKYCTRDAAAVTKGSDVENIDGNVEKTRARKPLSEERDYTELYPENDPFEYL